MLTYSVGEEGGVGEVPDLQILRWSPAVSRPLSGNPASAHEQPLPNDPKRESAVKISKLIILGIFVKFCVLSLKNPGESKEMIKQHIHLDSQSPTVANLLMYSVAIRIQ